MINNNDSEQRPNDVYSDLKQSNIHNHIICALISRHTKRDFRVTECYFDNPFYRDADVKFGCDGFVFQDDLPVHGIALRTQINPPYLYETFTIRYRRATGNACEYEKVLSHIENNELYPKYYIHSYTTTKASEYDKCCYVHNSGVGIYSINIIKTTDLYSHIQQNEDYYLDNMGYTHDRNRFFKIPFEKVEGLIYRIC